MEELTTIDGVKERNDLREKVKAIKDRADEKIRAILEKGVMQSFEAVGDTHDYVANLTGYLQEITTKKIIAEQELCILERQGRMRLSEDAAAMQAAKIIQKGKEVDGLTIEKELVEEELKDIRQKRMAALQQAQEEAERVIAETKRMPEIEMAILANAYIRAELFRLIERGRLDEAKERAGMENLPGLVNEIRRACRDKLVRIRHARKVAERLANEMKTKREKRKLLFLVQKRDRLMFLDKDHVERVRFAVSPYGVTYRVRATHLKTDISRGKLFSLRKI